MASPLTGVTIPSLSDVPNLPAQMLTAFTDAEKFFNLRFATTIARDAAISSPVAGMVAFVTADGFPSYYNGTRWVPFVVDTVDGADIADDSITNAMLDTTAGELGGAWAAYTATWTNLVQTSGSKIGRYQQVGKTVRFVARFTLGSGSSVTGSPTVTLPVTAQGNVGATQLLGTMYDSSATTFYPGLVTLTTTTATVLSLDASGTYLKATAGSGIIPFTWATGDWIEVAGEYEAA